MLMFFQVDQESVHLDPNPGPNPDGTPMLYDDFATPVADDPPHWSQDVSLRIDMLTLEAVYNMEEKITNASMQNKVIKYNFYF